VREIRLDCDRDAILLRLSRSAASPVTPARALLLSAPGRRSLVDVEPVIKDPQPSMATTERETPRPDILDRLAVAIAARVAADPATSYVAALVAKGDDAILKKIGEEATETVMAAKDGDKLRITAEVADLWFHCLVLLARHGLGPPMCARNSRGAKASGACEKAARKRDCGVGCDLRAADG